MARADRCRDYRARAKAGRIQEQCQRLEDDERFASVRSRLLMSIDDVAGHAADQPPST